MDELAEQFRETTIIFALDALHNVRRDEIKGIKVTEYLNIIKLIKEFLIVDEVLTLKTATEIEETEYSKETRRKIVELLKAETPGVII